MDAYIFGVFNPVTNAHLNMGVVAKAVLGNSCNIIYVPTNDQYIHDWKHYQKGSILSGEVRARLLKSAVKVYGFDVSTVEVDGITSGRTYDTLEYLGSSDPVLCIGMDNILQMKSWYRYKDILKKYRLLILKRGRYCGRLPDILDECTRYELAALDDEYSDISSTIVREYYKRGDMEQLKRLVPLNVYQYLEENEHVYF